MTKFLTSDYLSDYETAISLIQADPQNLEAKYHAVLALVRMGSLDFACAEHKRYELDKIRHHEDIMSLGGRLSKDLYLSSSGKNALKHARESAEKYERAFKDTQGFYSGINAATMALLAGMPWNIIKDRVSTVFKLLPSNESLSPEEHYFIEATRAECFLLLGETNKAIASLRNAIGFDPLNYTAHASTLKQFEHILRKQRADKAWLNQFRPPRPVHFAGNIWRDGADVPQDLPTTISDIIQSNDIGFGYGAIAAGADIVIAEAILNEGGELNIILPSDLDSFIKHSVRPFGEAWVPRFSKCVKQAKSLTLLPSDDKTDIQAQTILAARMAMGQAILRSKTLNVNPCQLLINDPNRENSLTAYHKLDWVSSDFLLLETHLSIQKDIENERQSDHDTIAVMLLSSDNMTVKKFVSLDSAIQEVLKSEDETHVLHFDLRNAVEELNVLMMYNHKGNILVSEPIAYFAALKHGEELEVFFAGLAPDPDGKMIRCFSLRPIAK